MPFEEQQVSLPGDQLRAEEAGLHRDEGEIVVLRQTPVAKVAEVVPRERRQSTLRRRPIHRFGAELRRHLEIGHLLTEK